MPVNSFDNYPLTWKPNKENLQPPFYKALAADLEHKIKSGLLAPGAKLPPQREIADYLDLNYTTITRVYDLCKKKGLIYGATGKGTFVAPHSAEDITITAAQLANNCIELGSINAFSEYSELVEQATQAVVAKGYLKNLYEYAYPEGQPHQLAAGARWLEQLGVRADAGRIAIFAGAQNALTVALVSLFAPGDKIATDAYTYANFIELAKMLHLVLVPVAGDERGMLPQALAKLCAVQNIKGVYLIPTCANPTTTTMPLARRQELAAAIKRNNLLLLEDDVASWMLAADGKAPTSIFNFLDGDGIYICGMTKSLCPGLRVAFMAFGARFASAIKHGLFNINIKTSALDAEIIAELILNGDAYKIAAQKLLWAKRNCDLYGKIFPDVPHAAPSYYQWLPLSANAKSIREIENDLLALGVRVYHAQRFAVASAGRQSFLRVALCSAGSARRLETGLVILKNYLQSQKLL